MKRHITKSFWVDEEKRTAQVRYGAPLELLRKPEPGANAHPPKPVAPVAEASQFKSAWYDGGTSAAEEISPLAASEILPREEDLYYLTMRALSQRVIEGYWIDYTRPGVLEASVPLLNNQRVCVDHCYWKAESAIGAIVNAVWDAQGLNSNGLPGINARLFVDSKIAPGIVRRLAYPVPAIHSASVTVGFEWEPSHPQLLEDGKFWWFLGTEVEGEIVRLIVTQIAFYRELSFVYEGADEDAKRLPDDNDEGDEPIDDAEDAGEMKKPKKMSAKQSAPQGANSNEVTTVKLTAELKKILGLEAQPGEDFTEGVVLAAVERLGAQVTASQAIIGAERAEVLRLATLAEVGAEGQLNAALAAIINQADATQLPQLKQMYAAKAEARFGANKDGIARSSKEEPPTPAPQLRAKQPERMSYL